MFQELDETGCFLHRTVADHSVLTEYVHEHVSFVLSSQGPRDSARGGAAAGRNRPKILQRRRPLHQRHPPSLLADHCGRVNSQHLCD